MFAESWLTALREKVRRHQFEQEYMAKFGPSPRRVFVPWVMTGEMPISEARNSEPQETTETVGLDPGPTQS